MYAVINKITLGPGPGEYQFTEIGYTSDFSLKDEINDEYDLSMGAYIENNTEGLVSGEIDISAFFTENNLEYVYIANTEVYDESELKGIEITSVKQL